MTSNDDDPRRVPARDAVLPDRPEAGLWAAVLNAHYVNGEELAAYAERTGHALRNVQRGEFEGRRGLRHVIREINDGVANPGESLRPRDPYTP